MQVIRLSSAECYALRRGRPRLKLAEGAAARQALERVGGRDPREVVLHPPVADAVPCARARSYV